MSFQFDDKWFPSQKVGFLTQVQRTLSLRGPIGIPFRLTRGLNRGPSSQIIVDTDVLSRLARADSLDLLLRSGRQVILPSAVVVEALGGIKSDYLSNADFYRQRSNIHKWLEGNSTRFNSNLDNPRVFVVGKDYLREDIGEHDGEAHAVAIAYRSFEPQLSPNEDQIRFQYSGEDGTLTDFHTQSLSRIKKYYNDMPSVIEIDRANELAIPSRDTIFLSDDSNARGEFLLTIGRSEKHSQSVRQGHIFDFLNNSLLSAEISPEEYVNVVSTIMLERNPGKELVFWPGQRTLVEVSLGDGQYSEAYVTIGLDGQTKIEFEGRSVVFGNRSKFEIGKNPESSSAIFGDGWGIYSEEQKKYESLIPSPWECFSSDTKISMGSSECIDISRIQVGRYVASYQVVRGASRTPLVPARVANIRTSRVAILLDFHGTGVTPGHVYWCGGGRFGGQFAPLIDIIRTDGVIVDAEGDPWRAATMQRVDGALDRLVQVVATGGMFGAESGTVRTGTPLPEGEGWVTVAELIERAGGVLTDEGLVRLPEQRAPAPFLLPVAHVPKPEDYVLARSEITLDDIYEAAEWSHIPTRLPAPEAPVCGPVPLPAAPYTEEPIQP